VNSKNGDSNFEVFKKHTKGLAVDYHMAIAWPFEFIID